MFLRDRVKIQARVATQTAMGETVVWRPVQRKFARVIPLDAKARATFQQMHSEVTHKIVFRDAVTLDLKDYRVLWKDKTLEMVAPTEKIKDFNVVLAKEL